MFDLATTEAEVCPYLGLPDDPRTRFTFADLAHRCHVGAKPIAIDLGHQGAYCLTTGYPACKRFRLPRAAGSQGSSPAPTLGFSLAPAIGVTARSSRDSRTGEGRGRSQGRALRRVGSLVAILAVVAVVGAIRAGIIGGSPADGGAPGVVASPAGVVPPVPTPVTSASTATPTAGSTPAPTATGTPRLAPVIHIVVRGDNLISIANFYGVTVKAIQDANKIVDPSLIQAGERLVIPPPP